MAKKGQAKAAGTNKGEVSTKITSPLNTNKLNKVMANIKVLQEEMNSPENPTLDKYDHMIELTVKILSQLVEQRKQFKQQQE